MNPASLLLLVAALLLAAPLHAADKLAAKPEALPLKLPAQAPDVAAPKYDPKTGRGSESLMKLHESFVKTALEGKARLVFLGDSITRGWDGNGKEVWLKAFGQYQPANFGIGGDRTQHVLWRITHGELDGIRPQAVVIMIGTNNSATDSAEGIARGITRIVETVRTKQPQAKILLLGIFPRGNRTDGALNAHHEKLKQVNALVARLDDGQHVFFLDIGRQFVPGDGPIDKTIMYDALHLTPKGYQIWADAIAPKLASLMK